MRHRTTLTAGALTAVLAATALSGCSSDSTSDDAKSTTSSPAATGGTGAAADGGASSAPGSTPAAPSKAPGKVEGHLDYTGDISGSADFTGGVNCEIKGGKLIGVTTPDVLAKKQIFPSFIATTAASPTQVALFNTPDGKAYSGRASKSEGVTASKSGSTWTVAVQGLRIAQDYGGTGGVITLSGSLTCTRLT